MSWEKADTQKALHFYSVSSDGKVLLWTLSKSVLVPEVAMSLRMDAGDDDTGSSLAGGCCFDFNQVRWLCHKATICNLRKLLIIADNAVSAMLDVIK